MQSSQLKEQQQNTGHCECGEALTAHNVCCACGIMIGSRHLETSPKLLHGKTYCSHCHAAKLIGEVLRDKLGLSPDLVARLFDTKKV